MSKSRNDFHRDKYRDFDENYDYRMASEERKHHRREKRMTNALRSKDIDSLYDDDLDDDYDYL